MAALDDLTLSLTPSYNWTAKLNQTGLQPLSRVDNISLPAFSLSKAIANATLNGGDMLLAQIIELTASGTLDLDLTAFTDAVQRASQSLARVKLLSFWLMAAADTINGVSGTACSEVVIGAASSNPFLMELGGTTPTKKLKNGDLAIYANRTAAGLTVGGSNKTIKLLNSDAVNAAKIFTVIGGGTT